MLVNNKKTKKQNIKIICYNNLGDKMEEIKIKGIYKHFKGDYYIVEDIAYHSETMEKMVVYRALYNDGKLFVRPYDSFLEEVNRNDQKYRYELQKIDSVRK